MYAYFKGTLTEMYVDRIILEVNGIGYNIFFPSGKMDLLPPIGEDVKIYTYTSVREDAINLYGFIASDELEMFRMLIGVSGIGPKGGLAILSMMSVEELKMAIVTGNAKAISKTPGVGAKTAERVIIDLKDKISIDSILGSPVGIRPNIQTLDPVMEETIEALTALGYSAKEAKEAVIEARKEYRGEDIPDTEEFIKIVLKLMLR